MEDNIKSIIGVVAKPLLNKQMKRNLWDRLVINDSFRHLIVNNGGIPIGIIPNRYYMNSDTDNYIEVLTNKDKQDLLQTIKLCDGIVLQGGLTSDTYEIEIVKYAIENNIPIIGICAGFNNIARALNLNIIKKQKLKAKHNVYNKKYRHDVYINKNHFLFEVFNKDKYKVNSLHSMFLNINDVNNQIDILATSKDDTLNEINIEAFTVKNTKFCLAIKWHPELMLEDIETNNLFKKFIEETEN